jgi:hypothetical protein
MTGIRLEAREYSLKAQNIATTYDNRRNQEQGFAQSTQMLPLLTIVKNPLPTGSSHMINGFVATDDLFCLVLALSLVVVRIRGVKLRFNVL